MKSLNHSSARTGAPDRFVRRLLRDEDGVALVEFAIVLPLLLLLFGVIIEGGRMMKSYQGANAGVRDATRYLARIVPSSICESGGSLTGYTTQLENIVRNSIDGNSILGSGIVVTSVEPSLSCIGAVGEYRVSPAPVAQVTATMTITFPFSGLFELADSSLGDLTTKITDQSRIFGT